MPDRRSAGALALAAAAVALSGCGGVDRARTTTIGTDCFTVSLARDFRYLDESNLIVFAPARQAYHLELSQACFGLRNQFRIALRSRTDRMCGFAGDAVIVNGAFAERCSVLAVRRLTEDQLHALISQFEADPGAPEVEVEIPAAEQ